MNITRLFRLIVPIRLVPRFLLLREHHVVRVLTIAKGRRFDSELAPVRLFLFGESPCRDDARRFLATVVRSAVRAVDLFAILKHAAGSHFFHDEGLLTGVTGDDTHRRSI